MIFLFFLVLNSNDTSLFLVYIHMIFLFFSRFKLTGYLSFSRLYSHAIFLFLVLNSHDISLFSFYNKMLLSLSRFKLTWHIKKHCFRVKIRMLLQIKMQMFPVPKTHRRRPRTSCDVTASSGNMFT